MTKTRTSALRIGILGAANIARQFIRDTRPSQQVKVVAVASRSEEKARAFAQEQGIERWHASYESLLRDPGVDAVYIPLPNSLHAEWAMAAAQHGKHVLCEKPLALGLAQARAMFATARSHGVLLLEAYPWWFQPQTGDMQSLLHSGAIGEVRSIQASFGFTVGHPAHNIRLQPALGGGALLDAGSYTLSLVRLVMGEAPQRVTAQASWAATGVDISLMATLEFAHGRRAQVSCAMDGAYHRRATLVGTQGTIETEFLNHTSDAPGHAWGYLPSQLRVRRGIDSSLPFEDIRSPSGSGFRFCAEAFAAVIAAGDTAAIERAAQASMDIAAMLEAIALSAREARPVDL